MILIMVICAAAGCESNSITSKELNISLYRLPRGEALKLHRSKNYGKKSFRQMKISEYIICILKKNALSEIYRYTTFICPLIYTKSSKGFERKPFRVLLIIKNH